MKIIDVIKRDISVDDVEFNVPLYSIDYVGYGRWIGKVFNGEEYERFTRAYQLIDIMLIWHTMTKEDTDISDLAEQEHELNNYLHHPH